MNTNYVTAPHITTRDGAILVRWKGYYGNGIIALTNREAERKNENEKD